MGSQASGGGARRVRRAVFRRAFMASIPVLMGYATMGFVAGVLLAAKGNVVLAPLWAFLSGALWVTGTLSIAGVPEIAARVPLATFALLALAVNFRYALYGFSMLSRWRGVPLLRKAFLVLALADENFALESASPYRDRERDLLYCTVLSALNVSYWVLGITAGAVFVCVLGHLVDPETIRRHTNGMEFSMAALFIVILTDQIRGRIGR